MTTKNAPRIIDFLLRPFRGDSTLNKLIKNEFFLFNIITPFDLFLNVTLGAVSGIGLIVAINFGADLTGRTGNALLAAALFLIFLYIFRATQITLLETCAAAVEIHLEETRSEIVEKLSSLEFSRIETIPRNDLFSGITKHYDVVNNGVVPLVSAFRSIPLVFLLFLYLGLVSTIAAAMLVIICLICTRFYLSRLTQIRTDLAEIYTSENLLFGQIDDMLCGFIELKFSKQKMKELTEKINLSIDGAVSNRLSSTKVMIELISFTNMVNYLFAGCIVFILPIIAGHAFADTDKIVALSLFLIGPVGALIEGIQQLELVKFSYSSIMAFKKRIDDLCDNDKKKYPSEETHVAFSEQKFLEINAKELCYSRKNPKDHTVFSVGPINLLIKPGKLILIEGGNGSGKTTLLRLITGLYEPLSGALTCNGINVSARKMPHYRELFGVIMADFHIFQNLYGFDDAQCVIFNNHLKDLDLLKCCIESIHDKLPVQALSTGQKKRLALAITLTEDRPVLVFDEWAADQDPYFRKKFYQDILPSLKTAGKSLIVVSHDDRYFDVADERYHMEDGSLKLVRRRKSVASTPKKATPE